MNKSSHDQEYNLTNIKAEQALAQGEFQKALDICTEALIINSENPNILVDLGNIYGAMGEEEKAKYFFEKALEKDANCHRAHHNIGIWFKRKGCHEEAQKFIETSLKMDPGNYLYLNSMANIYVKSNNLVEAEILYKKALSIMPTGFFAGYNLTKIYCKKEDWDSLLILCERLCDSGVPEEYKNKILRLSELAASKLGNLNLAITYLKKIIAYEPENYEIYERIADFYYRTGAYLEAIPFFEKALTLNEPNQELLDKLRWLYEFAGKENKD